jgi:uncharacterized protein (AIM24 family)
MNCKIIGYDLKSLEVELQSAESFFCEKGAIIYHEGGIEKNVKVLNKGLANVLKRAVSGESVFLVELTNRLHKPQKLMIAGKMGLLPVDLKQFPNGVISRKGYYVASSTELDIDFSLNLSSMIGGTGLVMQKISGNGTVFLDAFGSAILLNVAHGDTMYVDEKSFICMDANAQNRRESGFSGKGFLAGEGISMFRIHGPAQVYVNSVNH